MLLIFKDSIQTPGDPEDHAGEQEGKGIRSKKTKAGLKIRAEKKGRQHPAELHQKQRSHAEADAQNAVEAYPLTPQKAQRDEHEKRQEIAKAVDEVLPAAAAGGQAEHRPAQHRMDRGPGAPAHQDDGRHRAHNGHSVELVGKPVGGRLHDHPFRSAQNRREHGKVDIAIFPKTELTLHGRPFPVVINP